MKERALLVGVYEPPHEKQECIDHINELERLADTYGIETADKVIAPIRKIDVATYLGSGKVEELVGLAKELEVQCVIIDEDIYPSQQRNLEKAFGLSVMDRTELILGVFERHATTHEARLQVELAQLKYEFPRLKRLWTHLSRQRGGGVFLKGEGEKQIEIDKRLLEQKVTKVEKELTDVRSHRKTQRAARVKSGIPTFAICGYTNAGKSTLMNHLTDAGVLEEDMLFATLDTTTRKYQLPNNQDVLLVDTVGFIRKLPHQLVAAFKSTLEEVTFADILINVIDASSPTAVEQSEAALEVLKEIGASELPMITILNKVDNDDAEKNLGKLRILYSRTCQVSAKTGEGIERLIELMSEELAKMREEITVAIPQSEYHLVSLIMERGEILEQDYEENLVLLKARVPEDIVHKYTKYLSLGS